MTQQEQNDIAVIAGQRLRLAIGDLTAKNITLQVRVEILTAANESLTAENATLKAEQGKPE